MLKKLFYITFGIAFLAGILSSCQYEKLLKSSNYRLKYEKAKEYYNEKDYVHAIGLFEQLNPVLKATNKADTILYYLSDSYFQQEDYILAEHHFHQFYETFGNHQWADKAEFMTAYCNYKLSPRTELDQDYTKRAISQFELFIRRHPDHPRVKESHELIQKMKDKLAIKAYEAAKLYYNMEDYKAAIIALENCLKRFPGTTHREELRYLILQSKFLLASNSVQEKKLKRYQSTLDEYYTFKSEFSDSEYMKEVTTIFEKTQRYLEN
jgi:outer membrane protein assembly factor BamD